MGSIINALKSFFSKMKSKQSKIKMLGESKDEFLKRITGGKYQSGSLAIGINQPITQQDIENLSNYLPNLQTLNILDIDVTDIDFSVLADLKRIALDNVKFNNQNIQTMNCNRLEIVNADLKEKLIEIPENIKILDLYKCQNIENIKRLTSLQDLCIACCDLSKFDFKLSSLRYLGIYECKVEEELEKILNGCSNLTTLYIDSCPIESLSIIKKQYKKLEHLVIKKCGLKDIKDIFRMFPNLNKLDFSETELEDITPLMEYDKLKLLDLSNTKVDNNMVNVLEKIDIGSLSIYNTSIEKYLEEQVIAKKEDVNKDEFKNIIVPGEYRDVTALDVLKFGKRRVFCTSETLKQLLSNDIINRKIDKILIDFDENESIKQIVDMYDTYSGSKSDRILSFYIEKIPSLQKEDIEFLNNRYGITFNYMLPIQKKYPDKYQNNGNYNETIHIDKLENINERINSLLNEKNIGESVEEKINSVYRIMKENFELMQEKYDDRYGSILKNDDINIALEQKNVTSRSYIFIARELLNKIGIENVECFMVNNGNFIEPVIKVNDINRKINIVLNGKSGVTLKEESVQELDEI